jgi:SAM-dependent methyltransferase
VLDAEHPFGPGGVADLYDAFPFDADVAFYLDLAVQTGGRILEVACGSGRLVLPLATSGNRVVGIDVSAEMLAIARRKLVSAGLGDEVSLVEADMRTFDVSGEFDLALVAVRSFGYLLTPRDQALALDNIARHLRPGGVVALDLLHALPTWLLEAPGSLRQDVCAQMPDGTVVTRVETVVSTDLAKQVRFTRSWYEIIDPAGGVTKRLVQWPNRFTYRFEVEHLLARSGFTVEAVYGGYGGEPFTGESRTMLVIAHLDRSR